MPLDAAATWFAADLRRGLDRMIPPSRVVATGVLLGTLAIVDSLATWTWLTTGIAREGNPFVARLVSWAGAGTGLALRAGWTVTLIGVLTTLARRHVAARAGMVAVAIPLAVVTGLHALGTFMLW